MRLCILFSEKLTKNVFHNKGKFSALREVFHDHGSFFLDQEICLQEKVSTSKDFKCTQYFKSQAKIYFLFNLW